MRKLKDVTIQFVSFVKKGANKRKFFLTKEEDRKEPNVEFFVKALFEKEDEKRLVYGVVYEPGVEDAHGDIMDEEEIEKMAHDFLVNYRLIDKQHDKNPGAGEVVQSYIAPADFQIGKEIITKGSWVIVTKADEETWEKVKDGTFTGYSMAGWAAEVEEIENSKDKSQKHDNPFVKLVKALGLKVNKDFNTMLENAENNDIYRYLGILGRAIDQIVWTEDDAEKKKAAIIESLEQLVTKVRNMTFEFKKSNDEEKGEEMKTKEEILAALEDEELRKSLMEDEKFNAFFQKKEPTDDEKGGEDKKEEDEKSTPSPSKTEKSEEEPSSASEPKVEKSDDVKALEADIAELKKSLANISEALMLPGSTTIKKEEEPSGEPDIGIRAKSC